MEQNVVVCFGHSVADGARQEDAAEYGGDVTLRIEDQVLMMLEYWREYRTYFHIGQSWDQRKRGLPQHQMVRWPKAKLSATIVRDGAMTMSGHLLEAGHLSRRSRMTLRQSVFDI